MLDPQYNASPITAADKGVVPLQADVNGNLKTTEGAIPVYSSASVQGIYNSADASTAAAVIAGVAATNIYVTDVAVSVGSALSVTLQDNTGTPIVAVEPLYLPANSVWSKTFKTPIKIATGKSLMVKASGAGNISVTATGYQI
jgi:hypothetical protein